MSTFIREDLEPLPGMEAVPLATIRELNALVSISYGRDLLYCGGGFDIRYFVIGTSRRHAPLPRKILTSCDAGRAWEMKSKSSKSMRSWKKSENKIT